MNDFVKIKINTVSELLKHVELGEEGAANLLILEDHPTKLVASLTHADFNIDAVRVLAHALPKREAVWWSCLAVRQSPIIPESLDAHAIAAAEAWVRTPTEELRLLCRNLSEQLQHKTPASWAAMAAVWATGSLTEQNAPEVAPPEYLYAHAVAGAINLAAVAGNPEDAKERYPRFLAQGFDLARGGNGQVQ